MALIDQFVIKVNGHSPARRRPQVTLSYAQSLDGSIAARRGSPLVLSSPESQRLTHQLRAAHNGILVGVGTVLADDPRLTVRMVNGPNPQPIVLDSQLRTPVGSKLVRDSRHPPWIITTTAASFARQRSLERAGARVVRLQGGGDDRVSLPALLPFLADAGIRRLMVEGGAQVITSFLTHQLVDHLVVTIAPVFVGGQRSLEQLLLPIAPGMKPVTPRNATHFPGLQDIKYEQLGKDLIVWGSLNWDPR